MPYYEAATSPSDLLFILKETLQYTTDENTAGRPLPVKPATLVALPAFIGLYEPLVFDLTEALGERSREVRESTDAKAALELITRDYIEVLRRRTRRKKHDVAVLVNHGLDAAGDTPAMDNWPALKRVAEALVAGDAISTASYGAMANPSAAELQTALTDAQTEHADVAPADSAVQAAQTALDAQDERALFLVSEIRYDALDFARRENDSGQRRLLRKLGLRFKSYPGEAPEDPTDQPAPPVS